MITILSRTLVIYAALLLTMRFMGKRQLGELEISEFVTALLLSEVAALPMTNQDIPLSYSLLPILTLMGLEVLLSGVLLRCPRLKGWLSVRPALIIRQGRLDESALRSVRLSINELFCQLRQKDITDIADVAYAVLEPNGQLSVIPKAGAKPATVRDLNQTPTEHGMMHIVVSDGRVDATNLRMLGKDRVWLEHILKAYGLKVEDVLLMTADDAYAVRVLRREGVQADASSSTGGGGTTDSADAGHAKDPCAGKARGREDSTREGGSA